MSVNKVLNELKNKRSELEKALNKDMVWLANEMNRPDKGLMADSEHEDVTSPRSWLRDTEKAGIIVNALLRRVELEPKDLNDFLEILYQKPVQFKTAIRLLEEARGEPQVPTDPPHLPTQQHMGNYPAHYGRNSQNGSNGTTLSTAAHSTWDYSPNIHLTYGVPVPGMSPPIQSPPRPQQHSAHASLTPGVFPPYPTPARTYETTTHQSPGRHHSSAHQKSGLDLSTVDNSELDIEDLSDVLEVLLPLAAKFNILALHLRLSQPSIDIISSNHRADSVMALTAVIGEWLKKNNNFRKCGPPCWRLLVQVVEKMDYSLAENIAHEHRVSLMNVPHAEVQGSRGVYSSPDVNPQLPAVQQHNPILEENINLRKLGKIKYTDSRGERCELSLLEEMSVRWKQVGDLVGLSDAKLMSIDRYCFHDNGECMRTVATEWMHRDPEEFPPTWAGVLKMLEELKMNKLVKELQTAIADPHSSL